MDQSLLYMCGSSCRRNWIFIFPVAELTCMHVVVIYFNIIQQCVSCESGVNIRPCQQFGRALHFCVR